MRSSQTEEHEVRIEMSLIPAGRFTMGTSPGDAEKLRRAYVSSTNRAWPERFDRWLSEEMPAHEVQITEAFCLARAPITKRQFRAFVEATCYTTEAEVAGYGFGRDFETRSWVEIKGATWRSPYGSKDSESDQDLHPAVQVSWNDAAAYCCWLSQRQNATYRLPTEAEWEYACRAGGRGLFWWGDELPDPLPDTAFQGEPAASRMAADPRHGIRFTVPVNELAANPFGLLGMSGGVWEWCSDWHATDYFQHSPLRDPTGPASGTERIVRGGSWNACPFNLRSAYRFRLRADHRHYGLGFRVASQP